MQEVRSESRYMLRLETGEELLDALGAFARRTGIRAAAVPMGIGQLRGASLGFWNGRSYEEKRIDDPVELVALSGSIAESEGTPSVHLHAALGTADHSTVSGHVLGGTVGLLAEILVESFPSVAFARPMDERVGLKTLQLGPSIRP